MKKYDVVCLGCIVEDIVLTSVPRDTFYHDTTVAGSGLVSTGGDATNEAVTLAKLGNHVALLCKLGTDILGNNIISNLSQDPVDTSLIIRDKNAESVLSIVAVHPDGERSFLGKFGNQYNNMYHTDVSDEVLQSTKILTVGSFYTIPRLYGFEMSDILFRAKKFGVTTICDMGYDVAGGGKNAYDNCYRYVDYMIPSLEEARIESHITDGQNIDGMADWFLGKGAKNVIIKLGKDGCLFKNQTERYLCPAYKVKVIDTTGCGDAFVGAFTHAHLKGLSHKESCSFANAAGSLNATGKGSHLTIQNEQMILDFMNEHEKG